MHSFQRLIVDGVPGVGREAVRDASQVKLCFVVWVLHIELPVKAQFFFDFPCLFVCYLFDIGGYFGKVILPVNVRPIPADRCFGMAGKAPEERLYIRVIQRFVVNVQEEIAAGDLKNPRRPPIPKASRYAFLSAPAWNLYSFPASCPPPSLCTLEPITGTTAFPVLSLNPRPMC